MARSDDLSPPRRPIFFPVVIATVFLTVLAMTGGFVLGERHRRAEPAAGQQTGGRPTTGAATPRSAATGPLCPPETQATAVQLGYPGDLREVLKVRTENGTTVWICQDGRGALYYQGRTGGPDARLVEGKNGLFLPDVKRLGPDEYEAVAHDQNRFVVNRKQLEIFFNSRDRQVQRVVSD